MHPKNRSTVRKEGATADRDFIAALAIGFEEAMDVIRGEDSPGDAIEDVRERLEELENE